MNQDTKLWRSVVTQAFQDATQPLDGNLLTIDDRREARAWFRGMSDDFIEVCHMAELEPDYVRWKALASFRDFERHYLMRREDKREMKKKKGKGGKLC